MESNNSIETVLFQEFIEVFKAIHMVQGLDLSLPRIVFVGSKNCGKSDLLQRLIGISCLPNNQTKMPVQITFKYSPEETCVIFDNDKSIKHTDFSKIKDNIQTLIRKRIGQSRTVQQSPIKFSIYSSKCIDITFVDTPGLSPPYDDWYTYFTLRRQIAKNYCQDANTLILYLQNGNYDLKDSSTFSLIKQLYKNIDNRVIGVVTKLDIMDRGKSVQKRILNQQFQLKLGYVGIKSVYRHIVDYVIPFKQILIKQQQFFNSPKYQNIPSELLGLFSLIFKISNIIKGIIYRDLPTIFSKIESLQKQFRQKLSQQDQFQTNKTNSKQTIHQKINNLQKARIKLKCWSIH